MERLLLSVFDLSYGENLKQEAEQKDVNDM